MQRLGSLWYDKTALNYKRVLNVMENAPANIFFKDIVTDMETKLIQVRKKFPNS